MDRNARILAGLFGGCVIYALYAAVARPRWIEPLLTIDERIEGRTEELDKLEATEDEVYQAKLEYRDFLDRIGSFDDVKVKNDIRNRLNELIARYKLQGSSTSPTEGRADRNTHVVTMHVTVSAVGTLESAIGFLRDVSELPHVLRVGTVSLYPAGSSRKRKGKNKKAERVNIRVPIELMVLPQQRILGERLTDEDLKQPDVWVRHEDRDYAAIWKGTPFTEYIPLKPLVAEAGKDVNVVEGRRASLGGRAKGGDGQYTYEWSPEEGLVDATSPKTKVETAEPGTRTYTLTVNDESGNSAEDTVTVTVTEKPKPKEQPEVAEVKVKPGPVPVLDKRWKDRKSMQLAMTLMHSGGDSRVQEVMIYNKKSKDTAYYPVQADFDGGTLVGVHPRGGVVRRDVGDAEVYFVYPIGAHLDEEILAENAADYPVLQSFALGVRDADLAALAAEEVDGGDEADAADADPNGEEFGPANFPESKPGQAPANADSAARPETVAGEEAGQAADDTPAEPSEAEGEKPGAEQTISAAPDKKAAPGVPGEETPDSKPEAAEFREKTTDRGSPSPKPNAKAGKGEPARKKDGAKTGGQKPASGKRSVMSTRGKPAPSKSRKKRELSKREKKQRGRIRLDNPSGAKRRRQTEMQRKAAQRRREKQKEGP